MLAERLTEDPGQYASAWNFGPGATDAKPVSWIADKLACQWGGQASWNQDLEVHPRESQFLRLDISKAEAKLGWHPVIALSAAIDWIVEWYQAYAAGEDLGRLTRAQITRYESLLTPEI